MSGRAKRNTMPGIADIFAGPSKLRVLADGFQEWKAANADTMPLKNADNVAKWLVVSVLAAMTLLYAIPENETTIWLKTGIMYWSLTGTGLCIMAATLLLLGNVTGQTLYEVVQGYKAAKVADDQLAAGESAMPLQSGPEIVAPMQKKMLPELTDVDKVRISHTTNPKLKEETAARIKPYLAAGYSLADIVTLTGFALDTVKKYSALLNKGVDSPLSVEWSAEN